MQSMTGFGRAEDTINKSHYVLEIKSVNHRYLDARFRLSPPIPQIEQTWMQTLKSKFARGAFEILVRQKASADTPCTLGNMRFAIDSAALESFMECCDLLHKKHKINKPPSVEALLMTNKIFVAEEQIIEDSQNMTQLNELFQNALDDIKAMRLKEGKNLKQFLTRDIDSFTKFTHELAELAKDQPKKIRARLVEKIKKLAVSESADPQRLEWEIVYFSERSDITEEIDRVQSHASAFKSLLDETKPIGRKLDFLIQEMHREVNTIGAKASMAEITRLTVEGKTMIEKLREQIQNVE